MSISVECAPPGDDMDKLDALQSMPIFENVSKDVLKPLVDYFVVKRFERGDELWREGSPAHNFVFLVEGKIKIVKYRPDGGETILGVFDEGDAVGHIAVFRRIPYPASAVALDDSLCLEIYRDHFFGTIQRNTQLMECFIQAMMERNYHLVRRLEELTTSSAEQRLAMVFEKFAEKLGQRRKDENGNMAIFVDVPLSRRDIADLVNVRIETAIRMMSRWNKEGPVQTLPNGFLITDPARLSEIAEGSDDDF